jgi:hypothetical protein
MLPITIDCGVFTLTVCSGVFMLQMTQHERWLFKAACMYTKNASCNGMKGAPAHNMCVPHLVLASCSSVEGICQWLEIHERVGVEEGVGVEGVGACTCHRHCSQGSTCGCLTL